MTLVRPALVATLAIYSLVHFAYSGAVVPLQSPNLRQIAFEMRPLTAFLATGERVTSIKADQYGPTFFFVMHPVLRLCGADATGLSRCLYGVQLAALAASFLFTFLSLRLWLRARDGSRAPSDLALAGVLAFLWLNFAPLYYIVATKMVEMWELALMVGGLYAYLRGRRALAGAALGVAALIKLLPGIFVVYFALRDRRALAGFMAGSVGVLALAHVVYGPAMGFEYPLHIARAAVVPSEEAATGRHENLALRNLVWKAFGTLEIPAQGEPVTHRAYVAQVTPPQRWAANMIGVGLHAAALLVTVLALWPRRGARADDPVWAWAFLSLAMLVVAPAATFEYMLLAIFGFSFALVALLAWPHGARRPGLVAVALVAMLLVAQIAPRSVINVLLPIDALRRASGYTHLTLSETYQYFGIPLFGLIALWLALLVVPRAPATANPRPA